MKQKKLVPLMLALAMSTYPLTVGAADKNDMFADLPANHWAYKAVSELNAAGLITGTGRERLESNQLVTRYQMAELVASAIAHQNQADRPQQKNIAQLKKEFQQEIANIESLGQRISQLEHKTKDKFSLHGHFQQSIEHQYHKNGAVSNWWAKEIYLNPAAQLPGGWQFKAQFVTKMGSDKSNGWNQEELMHGQLYNGGNSRDEIMRPDYYYLEGNLGKTGQFMKIGDFQPWVQAGYVMGANIQGISLEHWGKGYNTHIFAGRLDVSNNDLAIGASANYDNAAGGWFPSLSQPWNDNVRAHEDYRIVNNAASHWQPALSRDGVTPLSEQEQQEALANGGTGSDNAHAGLQDPFHDGKDTRKTVYAFIIDKTFSKRLDSSLGYYRYKSAAYNRKPLHIGAATLNYKLVRNLNLQGIYAFGSQHGANSHDKGYMVDLMFHGNPWIPNDRAHYFGAYIGYHYLAPDTYIKCGYGDDIEKGQKGLALGMFYNFTANMQLAVKYGRGHSLTNHNLFREKFYSCFSVFF